jgi:predicted secreted acid phosphatase
MGVEVVFMAPEMELDATMADLQKLGFNSTGAMMDEFPHYGKTSSNMTLMEYKSGNRVVMVLSTSLGEASSMTGVKYATGNTVDDLFEAFGDKLILFPNPASN